MLNFIKTKWFNIVLWVILVTDVILLSVNGVTNKDVNSFITIIYGLIASVSAIILFIKNIVFKDKQKK